MIKRLLFILIILLIATVSWQLVENKINEKRALENQTSLEAFIPSPITVFRTFIEEGSLILREIIETLKKALLGLVIGITFAVTFSVLFLIFPTMRSLLFPIAFAINSFPIIGLAPAIVLAFGQGSWISIVFISSLICYFPTLISMDTAFRETDKDLIELMKTFNASKFQILKKVRLPLAMPYLFLSLKLALPASIIGATMGEWLGSRTGIGRIITIALYQLKPGLLYASLISVAAISCLSIVILSLLQQYFFPWKN